MSIGLLGLLAVQGTQCGCAASWLQAGLREIGLLPQAFPIADGLLPGETLQIHLDSPSPLALLERATQHHHGCVAQLLEREEGNSALAFAPLLELREQREHHQDGIWCSFTCVGVVTVANVELRTAAEEMELSGIKLSCSPSAQFLVANAAMLQASSDTVDYDSADDEEAYLASAVESAHADVNALRRKALRFAPSERLLENDRITSTGDRVGPPPAADDRVEYGYRLGPCARGSPVEPFAAPLALTTASCFDHYQPLALTIACLDPSASSSLLDRRKCAG